MFKSISNQWVYFLCLTASTFIMLISGQSSIIAQEMPLGNSGYELDTIRFNDLKFTRPAHLALDTIDNFLFVSDPGKGTVIMIDRKNLLWKEVFRQIGAKPDYIALDMTMKIIYWTDRSDGSIWRSNYDGSSAMPIYRKRNEVMDILLFDSSGNRLMYLDSKDMAIRSITTLGTDPGLVFQARNFDIKAMSLSSDEGLLYIGIESLPGTKIEYNTISTLNVKSRKSEPVLPNCTNDFSRILVSHGKLFWTGSNPGKLYKYNLMNSSFSIGIGLNHNPADFVWDEHTEELIYLTLKDKMIFVSSPGNRKDPDSVVATAADRIAPTDSIKSPVIDTLNPLAGHLTEDPKKKDTLEVSPVDSLFSSVKGKEIVEVNEKPILNKNTEKLYFKIHEVRIKLKTGNLINMFLHSADDKYLYTLSLNYLQFNYPTISGQEDLFVIPLNEVQELRILKSYDLEVVYNKMGNLVKGSNRNVPIVVGGLVGFGVDILAIAAGAAIFPIGTLIGGGIGLVVSAANYESYSKKFRANALSSKPISNTINLKEGIKSHNIQKIKSFAMQEFKPDKEQISKSGLIKKTNRN